MTGHSERPLSVKILTIIGFAATIALLLWLIILAAQKMPQGFAALAGMAKNMDTAKEQVLELKSSEMVINSGSSFEVSWTPMRTSGEYAFGYQCSEGVTLSFRKPDGALNKFNCEERIMIPRETTQLFVQAQSDSMRFTDITLILGFKPTEGAAPKEATLKITVVNSKIPAGEEGTKNDTDTKKKEETKPKEDVRPVSPKEEETKPESTPEPKPPVTRPTSPYPASDPNGFTDLEVKILSVGTQQNGAYNAQGQFVNGTRGAIRFDVKNVGTKRSGSWTFSVSLPNEQGYASVTQMPLGPQEHIESTLGFDLGDTKSPTTIIVTIFPTGDTNASNNSVTKSVTVR